MSFKIKSFLFWPLQSKTDENYCIKKDMYYFNLNF